MTGQMRLACSDCDRNDCDGINQLPADWEGIEEMQTLEQSRREVDINDQSRSPLEWYTHLGTCPDCQKLSNDDCHPIVRQIIDRDCHVSLSVRDVVEHVISRLRDGQLTFQSLAPVDRRRFIRQCIECHRKNRQLYVDVMYPSNSGREAEEADGS